MTKIERIKNFYQCLYVLLNSKQYDINPYRNDKWQIRRCMSLDYETSYISYNSSLLMIIRHSNQEIHYRPFSSNSKVLNDNLKLCDKTLLELEDLLTTLSHNDETLLTLAYGRNWDILPRYGLIDIDICDELTSFLNEYFELIDIDKENFSFL